MSLRQLLFLLIYNPTINYVIRNISKLLKPTLKPNHRIPPSGVLKLSSDSGTIRMATNQTSYLTQLLFWNGYKNFEYSRIFEELAKNCITFLDVGSNIGYYSLLAANSNSKIRAYAFEPALGPKNYLIKNISLNNFENNIKHVDLALSNKEGIIDFYEVQNIKYKYLDYNLAGEGNAGTKTTTRNFIKNTVNTMTLDKFVKREELNTIDLIKLDTEGTEIDILNSGLEILKKYQPIVICETLFNTIESELDIYFKKLDYVFFNHTENGLLQVSSVVRSKDDGIRNCFFVPKSKLDLISKFVIQA